MKTNRLLYITANCNKNFTSDLSVVLSPEFYWLKKIKLSTTKKRQVLSMAASVFTGALPPGEYRYKAEKLNDNEWLLIAFDREKILSKIPNLKKVNKIYFAQELCPYINEKVITIDKDNFLVCIDGVASTMHGMEILSKTNIEDILKECRLKDSIDLGDMQNEIMGKNSFYQVASVVFVFFLALALNVGQSYMDLSTVKNKQNALLKTSGLPSTSFERDSILSPLKTKQKQIEIFSKLTNGLTKVPHNFREILQTIKLDKNELILSFTSKSVEKKNFEKELSKIYKNISIQKTGVNETTLRLGL